jgi:diguanylate cyclase (GGDEF)-like protein
MTERGPLDEAFAASLRTAEADVPQAAAELRQRLAALPPQEAQHPLALAMLDAMDSVAVVQQGRFQDALLQAVPVLASLEASPWAERLDWLYTSLAFALGMLGDAERGLAWVGRALRLTENQAQSEGRRRALSTQGSLLAMLEQWTEARQVLAQSLAIAEANGHVRGQVVGRCNLAYACFHEAWALDDGHPRRPELGAQAAANARPARALAQAHGLSGLAGLGANVEGFSAVLRGDVDAATDCFAQAAPLTADNPPLHAETQLGLAVVRRLRGDWPGAREALAHAELLAREAHLPHARGWAFDEGMRLESAAGQPDAALTWARRGIQHWKEQLSRRASAMSQSASLFEELEHSRREAFALRQQALALEDAALHDPLTGALNRRGLVQAAAPLLRDALQPVAALMVDADHFKAINDQHGHALGDAVLIRLVQRMNGVARQGDLVARWGGEEFLLLLPHTDLEGGAAVAERLRRAVAHDTWADVEPPLAVTVSVGLTTYRPGESLEALTARADAALYRAKQDGRDRVAIAGA